MSPTIDVNHAVQSQHWCPTTVTLYNMIVYRHWEARVDGTEAEAGGDGDAGNASSTSVRRIVKESYQVFSDDTIHDWCAVDQFHKAIWKDFKERGVTQDSWSWWSDGAPQHFKVGGGYHDLTTYAERFENLIVIRSFGATGHFKGDWDATAQHVKRRVNLHMVSSKFKDDPIYTPYDYFKWSKVNLSERAPTSWESRAGAVTLTQRHFLFVTVDRSNKMTATADHVQSIHQMFLSETGAPCMVRDLACFCGECAVKNYKECKNRSWVKPPVKLRFTKVGPHDPTAAALAEEDAEEDDEDATDHVPHLTDPVLADAMDAPHAPHTG
uniref:Uncharacterized protein n=1 Tax=Mantoniella antarctica TaxID=81844 RepID=A0A7S0SI79_9CHLO|mmetsp:Transcript_24417/g.60777  ORF Transcript_24417/g.60777 Transcript_24417/m.60777 type:complete len:325 (+) Transcript_24417:372-1346(+)